MSTMAPVSMSFPGRSLSQQRGERGKGTSATKAGSPPGANGFHLRDRQQYITKCPSSSFLRPQLEQVDAQTAYVADLRVPEELQEVVVESFLEFTRAVCGTQLHLLCEEEELEGDQVVAPVGFSAARKHLYRIIEGGLDTQFSSFSHPVENPSSSSTRDSQSEDSRSQQKSFNASLSPTCFSSHSSVQAEQAAAIAARADVAASEISGHPGQLQAVVSHVERKLLTTSLQPSGTAEKGGVHKREDQEEDCEEVLSGKYFGEEEGEGKAHLIQRKRLLFPGALLPLALDDTVVLMHEATLLSTTEKLGTVSGEKGEDLNCCMREAEYGHGDRELSKLLDVLQEHVYGGKLVVRKTSERVESLVEQCFVNRTPAVASFVGVSSQASSDKKDGQGEADGKSDMIEASVVVLAEELGEQEDSINEAQATNEDGVPGLRIVFYFHFADDEDAATTVQSPEWCAFKQALAPLCQENPLENNKKRFRGVVHSRREMAGLFSETPKRKDPSPRPRNVPQIAFPSPLQVQTGSLSQGRDDKVIGLAAQMHDGSGVVQVDPRLQEFVDQFKSRFSHLHNVLERITEKFGSLEQFASGYKVFGFQRVEAGEGRDRSGWIYREWLPHAAEVYLFGDFNSWNRTSHPLQREPRDQAPYFFETDLGIEQGAGDEKKTRKKVDEEGQEKTDGDRQVSDLCGVWVLFIPDNNDGSWNLQHKSRVRVRVVTEDGEEFDRVPAWSRVTWKSEDSNLFNAVVWAPPSGERHTCRHREPQGLSSPNNSFETRTPRVYEAHIGASAPVGDRLGTYTEFIDVVLPRVRRLGYNTLLLNGVVEHADYASFGFYVCSPFAISSRFGTPEEFHALVDAAHSLGLRVLLTLYHSHSSRNALEGLGSMDGCSQTYFMGGEKLAENAEWGEAKLFDFRKTEVLRYLLSNLKFFLSEFNVDGYRFEGVTSMLYTHHGTGRRFDFFDYKGYFTGDLSDASLLYLSLANTLLSAVVPAPRRLAIANDWSGFPTLCRPLEQGGLGFDIRHESSWAQRLRQQLKQSGRGHRWPLNELVWTMANKPNTEKVLAAFEDADTTRLCRRPMSIALFSWESLHTHAVGGVAPHVTELAAGLARLGNEVHVFVRATGMESFSAEHFGVVYHECTFELNRDFVREMGNMCESFLHRMLQVEAQRGETFDICHAHDWLAAKAMVRAKQLGRTCIMTMHSTEFGRCGNNAYGGISKSIRDIEAEACHMADRVICVSGVLSQEVQNQYGVHPEKIKVIYNGIQCEKFDGDVDAGSVKAQYGVPAMDPMFLFVGRLAVQKGPDLLMEAIPFILKFRSDAKFVFVGDGHMMEQLVQRSKQLNVGHAVRFVGKSGGAALHALFKSCDAVVIPSRNEPFGIVVLEAWSSGKPVVATKCGGPRDFVNPDHTGYLVDPEPGSIAWGCCEILKNFEHSRWMGSRGRVTAAFSFSWDSIAKQTAEVYFEQVCRHDLPPNCSNARRGDCTMAFALIGPAMYSRMSVFDEDPNVTDGLAMWRLLQLLMFGLADGWHGFMANEFGHPDAVDLPRPANHFSMEKNFRRWNLADDTSLKFKHCELFSAFLSHWEEVFGCQAAGHLFVVSCSDDEQVVVFERGDCLFAINFHPTQSYEGYHTGCMYSGPMMRLVFDTDETRFGGFGRLTPSSLHPVLSEKDNRPHSVKLYLPSRTGAVYVSDTFYQERYESKCKADPIFNSSADEFVGYLATVRAEAKKLFQR